jgi:LAO/AO transport system kinase
LQVNEININKLYQGDFFTIAKYISLVENEGPDYLSLLKKIKPNANTKLVGITGAPGAGKSSLVNALLGILTQEQKKIAVLSVDPSSPFNYGALLGDRIRMNGFYLNENVYIRSIASRGALGGLSPKIIEIIDVLKAANFDMILLETVGIGQSEVEVAGLADTTVVVVVPEGGDEVQTMKAGVMEIADIFVVNKADRSNASTFVKNLSILSHSKANTQWQIPVLKTQANIGAGVDALLAKIISHNAFNQVVSARRIALATDKAYHLLQQEKMRGINKLQLYQALEKAMQQIDFNIYKFVATINNN